MQYTIIVSSKIIYKQQFVAAVQRKKKRKKNILQRQTVTTVKAMVQETVMATVNIYKKNTKTGVSVTRSEAVQMSKLIGPKQARYNELLARSAYNMTYSAYSVNVQRNSSEQIVERSGLALFDEGDDELSLIHI